MPGAIFQGARAQVGDLAALGHDHQARLIDLRPRATSQLARSTCTPGRWSGRNRRGRQRLNQGNQRGIGIEMAGQQHGKNFKEGMQTSSQV
jgi:hypothetical protein